MVNVTDTSVNVSVVCGNVNCLHHILVKGLIRKTKGKHKVVSVLNWKNSQCQNCISQLLLSAAFPSRFKFLSLFTFSVSRKVENPSNVASWKVRWGQGQTDKYLPQQQEKWNHMAHFFSTQTQACLCAQASTPPPWILPRSPLCLLSFVCSEVRHIDRGPIKNHNQMRTLGGGRAGRGRDEEKLKAFQAIAETIQLQCLSNLASQFIASNCLTKIDTSVATV